MTTTHEASIPPRTDLFTKKDVGLILEELARRGRYTGKRGGSTVAIRMTEGNDILYSLRTNTRVVSQKCTTVEGALRQCNQLILGRQQFAPAPDVKPYVPPAREEWLPYPKEA